MVKFLKKIFGKKLEKVMDRRKDVADLTRLNSPEAYEQLWSDPELLEHYLEPARLDGYDFIAKYALLNNSGSRILELGLGSGDFLNILNTKATQKLEIYGLDYVESGLKRARKLLPNGKFIQGDIYQLPYEDDFFDQIYCLQTLEHLKTPIIALKEMDRVCKNNGSILLTIPNGDMDKFEGHEQFWNESAFREFVYPRVLQDFIFFNNNRCFLVVLSPLKEIQC